MTMSKKEARQVYLIVKFALIALAAVAFIGGVHCLDMNDDGGTLVLMWLSGVLSAAFTMLEEE
jgi:hypothetical protein